MNSSAVQRRIEKKLRYRYLRRLASRRPDGWQFSETWRRFSRAVRRRSNRLRSTVSSSRLLTMLGLVVLACICLGFALGGAAVLGSLLVPLPKAVLLNAPAGVDQLAMNERAQVAFSRLAILQSLAWIGIAVVGIGFESGSANKPQRWFVKRSSTVRERNQEIFFLSLATGFLAVLGSAIITSELPNFWSSFLAAATVCLTLTWSCFWISRWLGQVFISTPDGVPIGVLFLPVIPVGLATIGFFWSRSVLPISEHLNWLGPIGWLQYHCLQIGNGRLFHWLPVLIGSALLCLVTRGVRPRVQSWPHRRRILELAARRWEVNATPALSGDQSNANLQKMIREEIRRIPEGRIGWIWPRWMAANRWMFWLVAVSCVAIQGFAVFLHYLVIALAEIPTVGGSSPELDHVFRWVVLSSLATVSFAIEAIGGLFNDLASASGYAMRPLSPWGLWKQVQWFGLLRIPTILIYTIPFLIVPVVLLEQSRQLPLLTLALSLTSLFALRTLLVAGLVSQTACTLLPSWIGASALWCLALLAAPLLLLGVAAALPVEGLGFAALLRQVILQTASAGLFGFAAALWYFATRLPKESD